MLVLSVVVPWVFRDAKAFQGVDQEAREARCSLAIALGPSFLSHLKTEIGWINLHNYWGYTKEVDDIYYCNMVGYILHEYTIIRTKILAWGATPIMGILPWYHGDLAAKAPHLTGSQIHNHTVPISGRLAEVKFFFTILLALIPFIGEERGRCVHEKKSA